MTAAHEHATGRGSAPDPILRVRDLRKRFGGVQAVDDATFEVAEGSITGLLGPNGSGKSTTFNLISGFERPDGGDIEYKGGSIKGSRPSELARMGVGRTFQLVEVFGRMPVLDNVLLAIRSGRRAGAGTDERDRAMEALELVGLDRMAYARAGKLSYGQQKLLDLATVLVNEPDLLLMDEPVAGITGKTIVRIRDILKGLRERRGMTILLIEHNLPLAMELCDWMHVLDHGQVIATGPPEQVRSDERVISAYLGSSGGDGDDGESEAGPGGTAAGAGERA